MGDGTQQTVMLSWNVTQTKLRTNQNVETETTELNQKNTFNTNNTSISELQIYMNGKAPVV